MFRKGSLSRDGGLPEAEPSIGFSTQSSAGADHVQPPRQTQHDKSTSGSTVVELTGFSPKRSDSVEDPGLDLSGSSDKTTRFASRTSSYAWLLTRHIPHQSWCKARRWYQHCRKLALRIHEIPPSKAGRHIFLRLPRSNPLIDERTGKPYVTNTVRSCRYTLWNFLPRQLFAQFSKIANFYFLIVSIFQMIPGLSTTGTYTTIIPVLFFVTISMLKEGYDDYRRYRLDKVENNREVDILDPSISTSCLTQKPELDPASSQSSLDQHKDWKRVRWYSLKVGDIVRLQRDDPAPADLMLLSSKGVNGVANIETMALDGETNLKPKNVPHCLAKRCQTTNDVRACQIDVVVEDPNLDLYQLEGSITLDNERNPLSNNEIIYRGSVLRNTPEAYGMVIYSGEECKIRMNANKSPRIKKPSIQAKVNKVVIVIVIFVLALALYNTVAYQVWRNDVERHFWYLSHASVAFFPILISFFIMFNTMIPLSLYVSQEIIKICQMVLLNDSDMYDEASNTPFEARTSTINEELGQVKYVFSDKTGTLTNNEMKFRKLSVAGTAWLHDTDLQPVDPVKPTKPLSRRSKGKQPQSKLSLSSPTAERLNPLDESGMPAGRTSLSHWHSSALPEKAQSDMSTSLMIRYLQKKPLSQFSRRARFLLLSMALCHTCLPEKHDDDTIEFQASSPDELAILKAAQELDYLVIEKDAKILSLKTFPHGQRSSPVIEDYEILDVIEFSSARKRMSVVVKMPDGRIVLFCKGADSVLMDRLRLASVAAIEHDELEKKANKRKSIEAQEVIRRRSEHRERVSMNRPSISRARLAHGRRSLGGLGPASAGRKSQQIRDDLDGWLTEHEHDVFMPNTNSPRIERARPSLGSPLRSYDQTMAGRFSLESNLDIDQDLVYQLERDLMVHGEATMVERCFQHINDFSTDGLRTLLYGHRFLSDDEYTTWSKKFLDASTSAHERQNKIEGAAELIEKDLELGGAVAIEDKLQHGVPETIDKLQRAKIKVWMLTGDKRETAINIGHTCRLIKDYSSVHILDHTTGRIDYRIAEALVDVQSESEAHSVVVIDGQSLSHVQQDMSTKKIFLDLAIAADSVICCRASPSQKAELVHAVRRSLKDSVTLAIGDGANDIAMIQEAHVGIGITGKEGLQAARSSDYSIAQFRYLSKLLLVHGRWNYVRISKYTLVTFWKETVFYLVQAFYQRYSGYTGTSLYENWSLSMFNTLFTSLCVITLGIFEQDLKAATLLAVPELYSYGQQNKGFNFKLYLSWMVMAICEAAMIYYLMHSLFALDAINPGNDLFAMGNMCFTACVIFINLNIQVVEMHYRTYITALVLIIAIGGWFMWNILFNFIYHDTIYRVRNALFKGFGDHPNWWVVLGFTLACVLLFEITVRSIKATIWPTDVETFQRLEKDPSIRRRFEEACTMELQQGWTTRVENAKQRAREAAEAARREQEIQEMLDRPRVMESGKLTGLVVNEHEIGKS